MNQFISTSLFFLSKIIFIAIKYGLLILKVVILYVISIIKDAFYKSAEIYKDQYIYLKVFFAKLIDIKREIELDESSISSEIKKKSLCLIFLIFFCNQLKFQLKLITAVFISKNKNVSLEIERHPYKSRLILEKWYNSNQEHVLTAKILNELSQQSNLTIKQVNNWIQIKKTRMKNKKTSSDRISIEQYGILKDYFENVCKNPGKEDQIKFANDFGLPITKIRSWFNNERSYLKKRSKSKQ